MTRYFSRQSSGKFFTNETFSQNHRISRKEKRNQSPIFPPQGGGSTQVQNCLQDSRNGKIIFTNITPWTKEYLPQNIQELCEDPATTYYSDGSKFEEEFYIVSPKEKDIVITKNNYDTFSNPEFDKILKENGIQYLVITGVFTDGCVLATICGGFCRGYNFVMLKDLIETADVNIRQELCKYLVDYTFPIMYGKTITSKELINSWQ